MGHDKVYTYLRVLNMSNIPRCIEDIGRSLQSNHLDTEYKARTRLLYCKFNS